MKKFNARTSPSLSLLILTLLLLIVLSSCNSVVLSSTTNENTDNEQSSADSAQTAQPTQEDSAATVTPTESYTQPQSTEPEKTNWEDPIVRNGIGKTVNAISGSLLTLASGTETIFKKSVYNLPLGKLNTLSQTAIRTSSNSVKTASNQYAASLALKLSNESSVKASFDPISLSQQFKFAVNLNAALDIARTSQTTEYFSYFTSTVKGYGLEIEGYNNLSKLSAHLSDDYLRDAKKVASGEMSESTFITLYGSHLVAGAYYGAIIEVSFYFISNDTAKDEKYAADLAVAVKSASEAGIGNILGGKNEFNFGLDMSLLAKLKETSSDTKIIFSVKTRGGAPVAFDSFESLAAGYADWVASISSDNYVMIGVPDNSLYATWDFLPNEPEYNTARTKLNAYFASKSGELTEAMLSKFGKTEIPNNPDDNKEAPPYKISFNWKGGLGYTDYKNTDMDGYLPVNISVPTRTGYMFVGMYSNPDGQGVKYYDHNMNVVNSAKVTSDIECFAYWMVTSKKLEYYPEIKLSSDWTKTIDGKDDWQSLGLDIELLKEFYTTLTFDFHSRLQYGGTTDPFRGYLDFRLRIEVDSDGDGTGNFMIFDSDWTRDENKSYHDYDKTGLSVDLSRLTNNSQIRFVLSARNGNKYNLAYHNVSFQAK